MADETTKDELEAGEGKVLPPREMMSLITTDPVDPMYSTIVPADPPTDGPVGAAGPPLATLPVEGPEGEADTEPRSETISQSDSESAG